MLQFAYARRVALLVSLACVSFYAGYISSSYDSDSSNASAKLHARLAGGLPSTARLANGVPPLNNNALSIDNNEEAYLVQILERCDYHNTIREMQQEVQLQVQRQAVSGLIPHNANNDKISNSRHYNQFLIGTARVSKHDLMKSFDSFGVATLESSLVEEAWLIYQTLDSFPTNQLLHEDVASTVRLPNISNITEALENCDALNLQFTHNPSGDGMPMCHLWIPTGNNNLPSYHVQRWMRTGDNTKLQHVGYLTTPKGANKFDVPKYHPLIAKHWQALRGVLEHVDEVLEEIRTIIEIRLTMLQSSDLHQTTQFEKETIIVMTVNQGQSHLLVNFLCAARARKLDVRRVLVFVTDEESKQLIEDLSNDDEVGVMVFYDKWNMEELPKGGEGVKYGDSTFTSMMFAKILCVLYVSLLGYDVLFQDVRSWIEELFRLCLHCVYSEYLS